MKNLKYFYTLEDYQSFLNGDETIVPNISYVEKTNRIYYDLEAIDYTFKYLTIEALEDGLTASLSKNACEYCVDGDLNWKTLNANSKTETINAGHTLSFRGNLVPEQSVNTGGIGTFTVTKKFNLKGNCMSMLYGDDYVARLGCPAPYAFMRLFMGNYNLISVSKDFLPSTYLSDWCYAYMFSECTSLITAPDLPATILGSYCYDGMFQNCTSLTTAPDLLAKNLYSYCYAGMFRNCNKLNHIKMLAIDAASDYTSLNYWVEGVSSTGTFVKHKDANIKRGVSGIPLNWTVINNKDKDEVVLIYFHINGIIYCAEEGMTWSEWTRSSYYDATSYVGILANLEPVCHIYSGDPLLLINLETGITEVSKSNNIVPDGTYTWTNPYDPQ